MDQDFLDKQYVQGSLTYTVRPRSSDPFYLVSYNIKWDIYISKSCNSQLTKNIKKKCKSD